ncbi:MAG: hypothetical protein LBH04_07525 [Tannerellaceae bacterium]|nr:hypothetical protein [Tannerellaceae bacterium]
MQTDNWFAGNKGQHRRRADKYNARLEKKPGQDDSSIASVFQIPVFVKKLRSDCTMHPAGDGYYMCEAVRRSFRDTFINSNFEQAGKFDSPRVAVDSPSITLDSPRVTVDSPSITLDSPRVAVDSPSITLDSPRVSC